MIAGLRRRHRRIWVVFACLLPVLALVAWRSHRPAAVMDRLPVELTAKP